MYNKDIIEEQEKFQEQIKRMVSKEILESIEDVLSMEEEKERKIYRGVYSGDSLCLQETKFIVE